MPLGPLWPQRAPSHGASLLDRCLTQVESEISQKSGPMLAHPRIRIPGPAEPPRWRPDQHA
jgi:hypothetical protein